MRFLLLVCFLSLPSWVTADTIRVAVASNFAFAMKALAKDFENISGHSLVLAYGSTGKHYAQIYNGAPFDAFFAADAKRPLLLEQQGLIVDGSRFSYALGRLVLWSPHTGYVDSQGLVLKQGNFKYLAIANPKLAPYGLAAQQVLVGLELWHSVRKRLLFGENISQTMQFITSGNVELGIIALSQFYHMKKLGSYWRIPENMHQPIIQQAVLLNDSEVARSFAAYIISEKAKTIIADKGYKVP